MYTEKMERATKDTGNVKNGAVVTREHIKNIIQTRFGFEAKEKQVDAIYTLTHDEKDLILVAKTGFGKSIIFQAAPLVFASIRTALIIMPIIALETEQCEKLKYIAGCKPFMLNGDTNKPANLDKIRRGDFTHGKHKLCIRCENLAGDN